MPETLPIEACLPAVFDALKTGGLAIVQAPPGAGKTTRLPLALLASGVIDGRILILEPRRVAARAAAVRMAETLGEPTGQTVGYRMRGDSAVSAATRIEVITDGLLTRMIQSDPSLDGVGAILFDEFHERALAADLGLALAIEIRDALRPDLKLVVMSATLDGAPVAALLGDAPLITSEGRVWPVDTRWLPQPWRRPNAGGVPFETALAALIQTALAETAGGILAFLPGEREISRTRAILAPQLGDDIALLELYGNLKLEKQQAAIKPATGRRKLVLATSIAETSLTIEDVRVVVDGGLARRPMFDSGTGMPRLITGRVSRAEADQRRGRAGRVATGHCYRMWTRAEEGGLAAFAPPEIVASDLTGFVLETANWGVSDTSDMALLTQPPPKDLSGATALLKSFGALDADGSITDHGRKMAALPTHPRLAHMILAGGPTALPLAALLEERDPFEFAGELLPVDLSLRLKAIANPERFERDHPIRLNRYGLAQIARTQKRLSRLGGGTFVPAQLAAIAFPDRIGVRRNGPAPRFHLSGGKGVVLPDADPLGSARFLVITNHDGKMPEPRVRTAIKIDEAELRAVCSEKIVRTQSCSWSDQHSRVEATEREMLGDIALSSKPWRACPPDQISAALCRGVQSLGLNCLNVSAKTQGLQHRVEWLRSGGADVPDFSDSGLLASLDSWLAPHLRQLRDANDLARFDPYGALKAALSYDQRKMLDRLAPQTFTAPTGTRCAIDYDDETPTVSIRLQELFGTTVHPTVGAQRIALRVVLLSPGSRPVQTTTDLPGFWANSYADVRKDMRGRYPKHSWPEDPAQSAPTRRAKPRK